MRNHLNTLDNIFDREKSMLGLIQKSGPLSKLDILNLTGLKLTTLNRIIAPLETNRLIEEVSIGESTGGRRPVLYDVNRQSLYSIGIDISRTYTQVVLTNIKMDVLYKHQFEMDEQLTPEKTVEKIANAIRIGLEALSIEKTCILGVGVGTVGPINQANGVILTPENFLASGWKNVPIKEMLESEMKLPVLIDNGANAAALVENLFGIGMGINRISYFNCGVGIRTGVISSGVILRTINNIEDAFGHMLVDIDGEKCFCGNYGCIEAYCSIPSILKNYIAQIKKGRETIIQKPIGQITFEDICIASNQDELLAKEVLTSAATVLGAGLSNYINLLSPEMVILSGPIISYSDFFFNTCVDIALKKCYVKKSRDIYFHKQGTFGDDAISVGAACMVVESYLRNSANT